MTLSLTRVTAQTCTSRKARHTPSILTVLDVWKERRALASLSDAGLKDIGISRHDAAFEAARPIWDLPTRCGK